MLLVLQLLDNIYLVIPAKTGIQFTKIMFFLDSSLRWNDKYSYIELTLKQHKACVADILNQYNSFTFAHVVTSLSPALTALVSSPAMCILIVS